jgi:Leucine-rich repeat (LRR) protein
LIDLQSLDLAYTNVTEVAPLLALPCLEILHLEGTRVSDLAMLATIEGLKIRQEI